MDTYAHVTERLTLTLDVFKLRKIIFFLKFMNRLTLTLDVFKLKFSIKFGIVTVININIGCI